MRVDDVASNTVRPGTEFIMRVDDVAGNINQALLEGGGGGDDRRGSQGGGQGAQLRARRVPPRTRAQAGPAVALYTLMARVRSTAVAAY